MTVTLRTWSCSIRRLVRLRGTLGAKYLHEDQHTRGQEALVPSAGINNFATYIFEKVELNKFTLSVGLRMDARKQKAEPNQQLKLPDYNAGETDKVLAQSYIDFSGSLEGTHSFTDNFALAVNIGEESMHSRWAIHT